MECEVNVPVALRGSAITRDHVAAVCVEVFKFFLFSRCQTPELFDSLDEDFASRRSSLPSSAIARSSPSRRRLDKFVGDAKREIDLIEAAVLRLPNPPRRVAFLLGASPVRPLDALVLDFSDVRVIEPPFDGEVTIPTVDSVTRTVLRQLVVSQAGCEQREFAPTKVHALVETRRTTQQQRATVEGLVPKLQLPRSRGGVSLPFTRCSCVPCVVGLSAAPQTIKIATDDDVEMTRPDDSGGIDATAVADEMVWFQVAVSAKGIRASSAQGDMPRQSI